MTIDSSRCFVIAEAGSNHNGSLALAKHLIEVAADAGADAVKFQVFRAGKLYPRTAGVSGYLGLPTPIYDVIEAMEMPYDWLPLLADACTRCGIQFMASAFDEESVDCVDPFVEVHKVASYELTHTPLLRHVARKAKPLIVSTGTSTLDDVAGAVAAVRDEGNEELMLMQCTGAYPAPVEALQLRAIVTMRERFGVPVGLSDHSRDPIVASVAAVALGAASVEKHFTLSRALPGPDHRFALEAEDLRRMTQAIRNAELALGDGGKRVEKAEHELYRFARRSIFAVAPIPAGAPFTEANVAVLRNGESPSGLEPSALPSLLGRLASCDLAPHSVVTRADVA